MIVGKKELFSPLSPNAFSHYYDQVSAGFQTTPEPRQTSAGGGHCSSCLLDEQLQLSHVSYLLLSRCGGQGMEAAFVRTQPIGLCTACEHQEGRKVPLCNTIPEMMGEHAQNQRCWEKYKSDPSRYLNNVSWLKWNALVRPSGGEFDIFCATCKIKRKCCWLLHCLLKGTGADRNVIKLPAAFICCHSSPCNEYNNNFIYSLA